MSASPEATSTFVCRDLGLVQLAIASGITPLCTEYDAAQNRCSFVFADSEELRAVREKFHAHTAVVLFHDAYDAARTVRTLINAARIRGSR